MTDNLIETLESYNMQLQQVEAAIAGEPDNEELLKLKQDLTEVINLTQDLLTSSGIPLPSSAKRGGAFNGPGAGSSHVKGVTIEDLGADSSDEEGRGSSKPVKDWKVGDRCLAFWAKDSQYYEAVVDGIHGDIAAVTFAGHNVSATNKLVQLRIPENKSQYNLLEDKRARKKQFQEEKDRRRKKAQKKAERMQQLELQREVEKKKWKDFNHKAVTKSMKGVKRVGPSIFAAPETSKGKVGVGTCGVSDRLPSKLVRQEKYQKSAGGYK